MTAAPREALAGACADGFRLGAHFSANIIEVVVDDESLVRLPVPEALRAGVALVRSQTDVAAMELALRDAQTTPSRQADHRISALQGQLTAQALKLHQIRKIANELRDSPTPRVRTAAAAFIEALDKGISFWTPGGGAS